MNDTPITFLEKNNRWYWGLLAGIAFPLLWYFMWWLFFVEPSAKPDAGHIRYGFFRELNLNVLRLCVGLNLILFYFFLNRKLYEWAKGIIGAVLGYVLMFIYLLYFQQT
ncbi:MAG: hypothetical protein N3F09_06715 [Bacteroidia bacterium]|nr:hypothetical protein [Bacteroidia bacterium]